MTSLGSLWLPILLSAVAVFVLSSIIHMFLPWHKGDYRRLPDEDGVMAALRPFALPPDDYLVPKPASASAMKDPEFLRKREQGPLLVMTVMRGGPFTMGPVFVQWLIYLVVVSILIAVIAASVLVPGAPEHAVFHLTGLSALVSYGLGFWPMSIWYHRAWRTSLTATLDAIIYAVATGLIFAWMWPRV